MEIKDLPMPMVGVHDLLKEVYAASVNPVDWEIREGYLKEMMPYKFPLLLGWDLRRSCHRNRCRGQSHHAKGKIFLTVKEE